MSQLTYKTDQPELSKPEVQLWRQKTAEPAP